MNWNDDFRARVQFAANVISSGGNITRRMDGCFENYDGDLVAVALMRRARRRPETKLAANLWNYLGREHCEPLFEKYSHLHDSDFQAEAARIRERKERVYNAQMAYTSDVRARPTYHDGTPRKAWSDLGEVERESWIKNPTPRFASELTPAGEQTVIPGCERREIESHAQPVQLGLFDRRS